MSICISLSTEH